MSEQQVATIKQRRGEVKELLNKNMPAIAQALPKFLTPDRMAKVVLTAINKTPKLLEATNASLMTSVIQSAQLGLVPDGVLGQAYLLPYENRRKGTVECQFIIGYKGYIQLAYRSGQVKSFQPRAVYEKDEFSYAFGLNETLHHVPSNEADRGELTHAYAVIQMKDGGFMFDVMNRSEIEEIRKMSKSPNSPAWKDSYPAMAMKSVIRRLAKIAPLSAEFQQAAALDEHGELKGLSQNLSVDFDSQGVQGIDTEAEIIQEVDVSTEEKKDRKIKEQSDKSYTATQATLDITNNQ